MFDWLYNSESCLLLLQGRVAELIDARSIMKSLEWIQLPKSQRLLSKRERFTFWHERKWRTLVLFAEFFVKFDERQLLMVDRRSVNESFHCDNKNCAVGFFLFCFGFFFADWKKIILKLPDDLCKNDNRQVYLGNTIHNI